MIDPTSILFIHGSSGDKSQTYKARLLRDLFPGMVTPDFDGELPERMAQLEAIIGDKTGWTLIGSSLGGLMAALFAAQNPGQVRKLALLAPALILPEFADHVPDPVPVPTIVIHGTRDELLPLDACRRLVEKVFPNNTYIIVDDDHRLHKTSGELDWATLLDG